MKTQLDPATEAENYLKEIESKARFIKNLTRDFSDYVHEMVEDGFAAEFEDHLVFMRVCMQNFIRDQNAETDEEIENAIKMFHIDNKI